MAFRLAISIPANKLYTSSMKKTLNRKAISTRTKRRSSSHGKKYVSLPKTLQELSEGYKALIRELGKR